MPGPLFTLAERVGIAPSYVDNAGVTRETSEDTARALLEAMGFDVADDEAARRVLAGLEQERSAQVVEPVRVTHEIEAPRIEARSLDFGPGFLTYEVDAVDEESGRTHESRGRARVSADGRIVGIRGPSLGQGTYRLAIRLGAPGVRRTVAQWLAVAPSSCTPLADRIGRRRVFGLWANLYSVRAARDLGVGGFGALDRLISYAGEAGAEFLGLNPLHALRNRGTEISPYSPASRLFRNFIYLDLTRVPELAASEDAKRLMNAGAFVRDLERARAAERVDYVTVSRLQRRVLEVLWRAFRRGAPRVRAAAFERYRAHAAVPVREWATFCALEDDLAAKGLPRDWRAWPEPLRDPTSSAVAEFRERRADAVDFHAFVQFEIDRQLASAARKCERAGMAIGLYTDLAVGSLASSFDAWAFPGLFVQGANLGAPPDAYSAAGQDWGLPPLAPHRLRADGYRYWRLLLRAAFEHCGMLRLDHAMGVLRQFWIPAGRSGVDGAYVRFPADDLLALLALESRRHGAAVVAEDLGTVPQGFAALLERWAILSTKVMFFERTAIGGFVPASKYSRRALLTADTHDQAPLAGWWRARDIEIHREVGLLADDDAAAAARLAREREKALLVKRLRTGGALPRAREPQDAADLSAAVHRYLSKAPSPLLGVSLDDVAGEVEPVNVPGVPVDRYPSWSRRMRMELGELVRDGDAARVLESAGASGRKRRKPNCATAANGARSRTK